MSAMPNIIQKIATLFICTLLLFSCLKEDMSNCPEEIRVYFKFTDMFTLTGEGYPINPGHVDRMHLYIFNDKGYYLGEYRDEHIAGFSDEYYIDCSDLLPGKYSFIAWGGKDEECYSTSLGNTLTPPSFVKSKTTFDEALLTLNRSGNNVSTPVHHLFHSGLPATVTNAKVQRFDMPLMQITNTINIRTVGLPYDGNTYRFNIKDNNDVYTFDGSFATRESDPFFTYTAPCMKDKEMGQLSATLNVMRLAGYRHSPQLQISNETAGNLLYHTDDLISLIERTVPDNDFDTTHIYDIEITFDDGDDTGFTFTIMINGWVLREQNNELSE